MKVAGLQLNLIVGDLNGNRQRIASAVRCAAEKGAQLCLTTELAICGYPPKDLLLYGDFVHACMSELTVLAHEIAGLCPVLVGCPIVNRHGSGKPIHNGAVLIYEGGIVQEFGKTLLPTYDVFDEARYFEPWNGENTFVLHGTRLGVTICEDIWNDPEFVINCFYAQNPVEKAVAKNVQALLNLSASPFSIGKQAFREKMVGGLAHKHGVSLVYVNQVGGNDDLVFDGRSIFFDAQGVCRAKCEGFREDMLMADLGDLSLCSIAPNVGCKEEEIWHALVLATRDYAHKNGFSGVVLGLSGGIDSALTAAVAAEALGPENVLALLLPSPYSSQGSIDDSLALAINLGIQTATIPIDGVMQAYDHVLSPIFSNCPPDITEENIQSRIRGNLLMAVSNKFGLLLLTTGNKSELAVGYCTIYGDMSGGFAVISDLPKTSVYAVCEWLNKARATACIPLSIMNKAPSAELRPDQTDQQSLPPYDVLDSLLDGIVVQRTSPQSIPSYEKPSLAMAVGRLLQKAEFKRKQAAPGPKISANAFGSGWRMPLAAKWWDWDGLQSDQMPSPKDIEQEG